MMIASPATVLGSEMHLLESKSTGRTYRITISLPLGYSASLDESWPFDNEPAKWPVVYLLDGNWYANMVTDMVRSMAWCGSTTDAIVVGIGYSEDSDVIKSFRETFSRRDLELAPVPDSEAQTPTGDAENFYKFVRDELIPFVETDYRADSSRRILVGHSLGGLFALFGLLQTPNLFNTLIIGSPSLWYGNRVMLQQAETFANEGRQLHANVYLYVGELEETSDDPRVTDTLRLADILQSRSAEGVSLVKRVFPDTNHCEVVAPGFQAGLKFALKT